MTTQLKFNKMVGTLDQCLSFFVEQGRQIKKTWKDYYRSEENYQTIKHHAEDMILAGRKILRDLGQEEPK